MTPDSFAATCLPHYDAILGYCRHRYRDTPAATAEDIAQLVYQQALAAWPRYRPQEAGALSWLMAIAHNALSNRYRWDARHRREYPMPEDLDGQSRLLAGDAEREALARIALAETVAVVRTLPERQREAITRAVAGLPLGARSYAAQKAALFRARVTLRELV